jgi:hypothetical protein
MARDNHNPIEIKPDKRFKPGNIKQTGSQLRGNPETVALRRLEVPPGAEIGLRLNPPIVVSKELGNALTEHQEK